MITTFSTNGRGTTSSMLYRPPAPTPHPPAAATPVIPVHRPAPNVTDDYERWYTETTPNNRMVLSLRSGIHSEIGWAFDRLTRLCHNEQFTLRAIPGLTDALFEWPEWYIAHGQGSNARLASLFSLSPEEERKRRHGLEALFVMRNAAVNVENAEELAAHKRTRGFITSALYHVAPDTDTNTEFLLHILEILHFMAHAFPLPPPSAPRESNLVPALTELTGRTTNRSLILASLTSLNLLLTNPGGPGHLTPTSPALSACLRYIALLSDKVLVDASVNYLYTHLSHPPLAQAFLLHPDMPGALKLLVSVIISEQQDDVVVQEVGEPVYTAPSVASTTRNHELTKVELEALVGMPEPQRCYEWMRAMFVANPQGELTQVDFWNLYKDIFVPYQDRYHLLVASDVIKNVNVVFPQAQAMVLPGPPQKFVVRGVDRRKEENTSERFQCRWYRSQCPCPALSSSGELYDHVLEHINEIEESEKECVWSTCLHPSSPKPNLRAHILTHLPSAQPQQRHPSQSDTVTLPSQAYPYPTADPTTRPLPPPRRTTVTYRNPRPNPPSAALTALLCVRILFRTSFMAIESAPRVDADHFGFPGIVEETDQEEAEVQIIAEEEGMKRGRKAFVGVRRLLEGVRIQEEALMGWVTEMIQAVL